MSSIAIVELADSPAREQALDTGRSILVQAPAGSGKTELLTTRFLKLLAEVDEPEEILAITFTKAATAEMRHRILKKLEQATLPIEQVPKEDLPALPIARAALARSEERGWRLLDQPRRLDIQTIDSLCLRIAHQLPLAAKLGGTLNPTERAEPLYRQAARNTFDRLGGANPDLNEALEALLLLRDSNLANCEALLARMLQTRDQWAHAFPLSGDVDWQATRVRMQAPFEREARRVLKPAHDLFSTQPRITAELLELANYACQGGEDLKIEIHALAGSTSLPPHTSPEHWKCIANLLLKKSKDDWLISANKRHGFPAGANKSFEAGQKDRRKSLIADLQQIPNLLELLSEIRQLPPVAYSDEQWRTLRHFFTALRHAAAELDAVFAEAGAVDFVEIGMNALQVLQGELAGNQRIRHLLVDEFQDTSRRQHELVASLLRDWTDADGRTLFLVGDPMQSIYLFRQADVELFDFVKRQGFAAAETLRLHPLQLKTNFRSCAELVNPLNAMFQAVFPHQTKHRSAGVDFLPSIAPAIPNDREKSIGIYRVHPAFLEEKNADDSDQRDPAKEARQQEIAEILDLVQRHLPRVEQARAANKDFTVAILGRAKNHLTPIAAALRREQIPFRAVELETLGERQEILDLQSIVRALLHPMDRIAWLSILRAPWCGLDLSDLHRLCGTDDRNRSSVQQQIEERLHLVEEDARQRVARVLSAIDEAQRHRHAEASFSSWIERTWTALGGPACLDAAGHENALAYFAMLDDIAPDGIAATGEEMSDQLGKLFAKPDPAVGERCGVQLMTIHKAKGLGFNVVILPALHKQAGRGDQPLIQSLERTTASGTELAELLVAPIGEKGADTGALYKWVSDQKKNRETEERKRLLYVACTRAREELHLFATVTVTESGLRPQPGSLLATAWPALEAVFEEHRAPKPSSNVIGFPAPVSSTKPAQRVFDIAAVAEASTLRRLPSDWQSTPSQQSVTASVTLPPRQPKVPDFDRERPHAGRSRRVLGNTVHLLFEQATQLLQQGATEATLRGKLPQLQGKAESFAWNEGLARPEAVACAKEAVGALDSALRDVVGLWLLSPHLQDQTEISWTGILDGAPTTLRIDRSFLAGDEPLADTGETLWIVDYKTATCNAAKIDHFLKAECLQYQDQLEKYGRMMHLVHGPEQRVKLGLYYPLLNRLISWSC
jgi:ATP-dependent exoDNAse (exonuclease V) beta subunit